MSSVASLFSATAGVFVLLVMLRAALHKAMDFSEFTGFVADYRLLPAAAVTGVSALIVAIEIAVVVAQAVPATRAAGLSAAMALLVIYAGAIGINIARGHTRIECGCGGAPQMLGASLILRNALLIAVGGYALAVAPTVSGAVEAVTVLAAAVFSLIGYALFEQINANRMTLTTARLRG